MLAGHLDSDKLYTTLWHASINGDLKLQRQILSVLMSTDDAGLMEQCQDLLIAIRDPTLLKEVLVAFQAEKNPDRRLALAYVVGGNWEKDAVRPAVMELLHGDDARLLERMLVRMSLQELDYEAEEDKARACDRLKVLVKAGVTDGLRYQAADAMRGAYGPEDIKFLIDVMLRDPSAEVQRAAFNSLPSNFQSPSPMIVEQTRAMYTVATDATRPDNLRRMCADRALQNSLGGVFDEGGDKALTPQERETLKEISGRK